MKVDKYLKLSMDCIIFLLRDLRMIAGCTVVCLLMTGANCRIMFCLQVIGGD